MEEPSVILHDDTREQKFRDEWHHIPLTALHETVPHLQSTEFFDVPSTVEHGSPFVQVLVEAVQ